MPRVVEMGEHVPDSPELIGPNPSWIAALDRRFNPPWGNVLNVGGSYLVSVNCQGVSILLDDSERRRVSGGG